MKQNESVNYSDLGDKNKGEAFMRKGQIGDWKNHFTPQMNQEWDQWIKEKLARLEGCKIIMDQNGASFA